MFDMSLMMSDVLSGPALIAVAVAFFTLLLNRIRINRKQHVSLPSIVPSGPILSYFGALKFVVDARRVIADGYQRFGQEPFKIPELNRWTVLLSKREQIEELMRLPDSTTGFIESSIDRLALDYLLPHEICFNPRHVPVIQQRLTRNLGVLFDDIVDEIDVFFKDLIPEGKQDWVKLPAMSTVLELVARTGNRIFVGAPLCRDPDFTQLNIEFANSIVTAGFFIDVFPKFLKPLAAKFVNKLPSCLKRSKAHLAPVIKERLQMIEQHGRDYDGKPNDFLGWMIDEMDAKEKDIETIIGYILLLNFAAIHTSTMTLTHALFHLASKPEEYLPQMREEIEAVVKAEGWTKASLVSMRKVDSFIKESLRFNGIGFLSGDRKALKDFTFSDGTFIPKGTHLAAASSAIHMDETIYKDAGTFKGFRFAEMRQAEGEGVKHQMVNTNYSYLPFGHGRHACPGRFFAANELKAMLAYVALHYDIKLAKPGERPSDLSIGTANMPNSKAEIMLKRRD